MNLEFLNINIYIFMYTTARFFKGRSRLYSLICICWLYMVVFNRFVVSRYTDSLKFEYGFQAEKNSWNLQEMWRIGYYMRLQRRFIMRLNIYLIMYILILIAKKKRFNYNRILSKWFSFLYPARIFFFTIPLISSSTVLSHNKRFILASSLFVSNNVPFTLSRIFQTINMFSSFIPF